MNNSQRARWECHACDKVAFGSKSRALTTLRGFAGQELGNKVPVRAYECQFGNGWHLTSQEDWAIA